MRKKILTFAVLILLGANQMYAFGPMHQKSSCNKRAKHKAFGTNRGVVFKMMSIILDMDLTKKQWAEIKQTMLEIKKQRLKHIENQAVLMINFDKVIEYSKDLKLLYVEDNQDAREMTMMVLEDFFDDIIAIHNQT